MPDADLQIITPSTHDLGAFKVRRTLPTKARTMVGPFIFVDQFGPAHLDIGAGMDVRPHPHINLATVTYLFEGAIDHRDSLGTLATIRPGAVNLMTAGSGIVHSERSPGCRARDRSGHSTGCRPGSRCPTAEEIDPAFEHVANDDLPLVEDGGARARIIMGSLWGATAPTTAMPRRSMPTSLLNAGGSDPDRRRGRRARGAGRAGDASLDGERARPLQHCISLKPGQAMTLRADSGARVMLLGGEAFATPRHVWWNFVSSSRDRINQAKEDWQARADSRWCPATARNSSRSPRCPRR